MFDIKTLNEVPVAVAVNVVWEYGHEMVIHNGRIVGIEYAVHETSDFERRQLEINRAVSDALILIAKSVSRLETINRLLREK